MTLEGGDTITPEDLRSVHAYRSALHRTLIQRRQGRYSTGWLAQRLGVSVRTIQNYNQQTDIHVDGTPYRVELTFNTLHLIPESDPNAYHWLRASDGKCYPPIRALAGKLLKQGLRVIYERKVCSYYSVPDAIQAAPEAAIEVSDVLASAQETPSGATTVHMPPEPPPRDLAGLEPPPPRQNTIVMPEETPQPSPIAQPVWERFEHNGALIGWFHRDCKHLYATAKRPHDTLPCPTCAGVHLNPRLEHYRREQTYIYANMSALWAGVTESAWGIASPVQHHNHNQSRDRLEQASWTVVLPKDLAYRYLAIDPVYFRYPFTQSLKRLVRLQAEGYGDTFTPDSVGVFIDLINSYGLRVKQARAFVEDFVRWFGDVDALRRVLDDVDSQIFGGGIPVRDYRAYTVDYLKRELHKLS